MRARRFVPVVLLACVALLASPWGRDAGAVCPSTKQPEKSRPPPPDPPPEPPPTTQPGTPTTPPSTPPRGPTTTPRGLPPALDAEHEGSWEAWWDLNGVDFLPRVERQPPTPVDPDGYAPTLDPRLRGAIDLWLSALEDADRTVRQAAAGAFVVTLPAYRRADVQAALERAFRQTGDDFLRDLAGLALARRRVAAVAPALRKTVRSRHEVHVSRAYAAIGLVALDDAESVEDVAALTTDLHEPELAGAVLIALGQTRDLRHLPVLHAAAERRAGPATRLRRVRCDAIVALGKLGCPATVPMLGTLLADREKAVARSAALALGGFPGNADAVRALRTAGLTSEDAFVRGFSGVSLGRLGDPSVLPSLGPRIQEDEPCVRGFSLLALGLFRSTLGAPLLREPLSEDPRTTRFGAAALAAGLSGSRVYRELLAPAVDDPRSARVPSCGALGLALLGEKPRAAAIRARSWLDSALWRPGFAEALALLDPADQSTWLLSQLSAAKRSTEKQALVRALAYAGGPDEAAALVDLWKATSPGDSGLRVRIVNALAPIVNDRELSFARRTVLHTYYPQVNIVLAHLEALP